MLPSTFKHKITFHPITDLRGQEILLEEITICVPIKNRGLENLVCVGTRQSCKAVWKLELSPSMISAILSYITALRFLNLRSHNHSLSL